LVYGWSHQNPINASLDTVRWLCHDLPSQQQHFASSAGGMMACNHANELGPHGMKSNDMVIC